MKPFDINLAKQGNPVCTRDGRKARILCFDRKSDYPIIALIDEKYVDCYTQEGSVYLGKSDELDLFMVEEDHFNVSELKPFDKVLVRDADTLIWKCGFFSHINKKSVFSFVTCDTTFGYKQCIPYNDETMYLRAITESAPEKYVNW